MKGIRETGTWRREALGWPRWEWSGCLPRSPRDSTASGSRRLPPPGRPRSLTSQPSRPPERERARNISRVRSRSRAGLRPSPSRVRTRQPQQVRPQPQARPYVPQPGKAPAPQGFVPQK